MKRRITFVALLLAIASMFTLAPFSASAAPKERLLRNVPVKGTLSDGGTFSGVLTITNLGYNDTAGLVASGVLKGGATAADGTKTDVQQAFSNVELTLSGQSGTAAQGVVAQASCDILFLDLGPLNLDLLGLTVDLSQIVLDINAVPGAGNLLGNLLCAVVGLLDPGSGLLSFLENLTQLLNLLGQINNLLG